MTHFYIMKDDMVYCECLDPVHMPEQAPCGFDTKERAKSYIDKYKIPGARTICSDGLSLCMRVNASQRDKMDTRSWSLQKLGTQ